VNAVKGWINMAISNKEKAVSFLELVSTGKVREAYSKYIGAGFRHHNPYFEGSAESLEAAMQENARQNPDKVLEVKRVIGEKDFIVAHGLVRHKLSEPGVAVVHIFRFEQGRIIELWDVGQPIPDYSPNQYGMF
jgi:predicted SnoaL-like aldol condensation-catalyzing enzyme